MTGGVTNAMLQSSSLSVLPGTGLSGGGAVSLGGWVILNVNTAAIQSRVSSGCTAGSSIRAINADGSVLCQTDTNSGGTVTSVGTGAGLTGGPITGSGTVSVASGGITQSMLGTGAVSADKISFYGKVAIVATSGGDYSNPATAMSNYGSWCGTPSDTNPCLLKIMPGVYNVGSSPVVMRPYIDIEGSGEKTTKITGAISSSALPPTAGLVKGVTNAELRFLTVENAGTGSLTVAILNSTASPSILHVTATASLGTYYNVGVYNFNNSSPTMMNVTANGFWGDVSRGVTNNGYSSPTMTNVTATAGGANSNNIGVSNEVSSSPTMTNVTATASVNGPGVAVNRGVTNKDNSSPTMTNVIATGSGWGTGSSFGVYSETSSSPTMTNVTATASGAPNSIGVYNGGGTTRINHSVIKGLTGAIANGSGTTLVGNTQLDGGTSSSGGPLICAGVYDENYTFYANTCP